MTLWAIVPVKPLRYGKSRLAGTLTEDQRTELNRALLQHTLETLSELKEVDGVLVVSRDPHALTVARSHGARTVQENGQPQLNTALQRATVVAQVYATRGVLVLPADLPLIKKEDILELAHVYLIPHTKCLLTMLHSLGVCKEGVLLDSENTLCFPLFE